MRELGLELKMTCLQADAQAIPLHANSVDRITCRFGVMFIDDFALAAYDMLRVLKHGGRIALLVWGPFVQPFFDATVGVVLQRLPGTGMPPEAQKMFRFAAPGSLDRELRAAGFSDVHEERLTLPRIWAGAPQDLWDYQQEISTLCHPLYAAIPLPLKQEVDARVSFELARFAELHLQLKVNGQTRQDAVVAGDMIYSPLEALRSLARFQPLSQGDLILTGTPAGTALSAPPKPIEIIGSLLPAHVKWKAFFKRQSANDKYLADGDVVTASVSTADQKIDLGVQRTTVRFAR